MIYTGCHSEPTAKNPVDAHGIPTGSFTLLRMRASVAILCFFLLYPLTLKASSYRSTLHKWTRSDTVYIPRDFHVPILWHAVWLKDDVLKAQAAEYAKLYRLSEDEEQKVLADLMDKKGGENLYFVSFYSSVKDTDDLTNPRSNWDLRLKIGDETFSTLRMEKINKPTLLQKVFYPFLHPWAKGYYVWFSSESADKPGRRVLSLHGPEAHSGLVWKSK